MSGGEGEGLIDQNVYKKKKNLQIGHLILKCKKFDNDNDLPLGLD